MNIIHRCKMKRRITFLYSMLVLLFAVTIGLASSFSAADAWACDCHQDQARAINAAYTEETDEGAVQTEPVALYAVFDAFIGTSQDAPAPASVNHAEDYALTTAEVRLVLKIQNSITRLYKDADFAGHERPAGYAEVRLMPKAPTIALLFNTSVIYTGSGQVYSANDPTDVYNIGTKNVLFGATKTDAKGSSI